MAEVEQGRLPESSVDMETLSTFLPVIGVLLLAETLILLQRGDLGLVAHALGIVVLIRAIHRSDEPASLLLQALLLLPVLRIFNLGLPIFTGNSLVFLGVIYAFLLLSAGLIVRSQHLSLDDLGLTRRDARLIVPGTLVGVLFGLVQYLLDLEQIVYEPTLRNYLLVVLTAGLLVGLVEELIFRGLIQRWMTAVVGRWPAIVGVSLLFGFMHSVWLTPLDIVFAGTVSLFLGWVYAVTNNLWFITGIHGSINVTVFLLAPLYLPSL